MWALLSPSSQFTKAKCAWPRSEELLSSKLSGDLPHAGYDASAHMVEETQGGDVAGPMGIITSVGVSAFAGFFYIVSVSFSVQDYDSVLAAAATGNGMAQLFWDAFMARWVLRFDL